jgi:serine/alanine adding enzyme
MSGVSRFKGSATEWDEFVATQPSATASHLYGWKRVIERVYGHDCPYFVHGSGSGITGVLPLVNVRSLAFGRFLVSMPYLNAGGPLGDEESVRALQQAALELGKTRRSRLIEFRCREELPIDHAPELAKIECTLPLPAQPDALWSALGGKLRSQIRRPQKEGIEVRFGSDQLDPFFTVFARNMRDLGSPTHPRAFFRAASEELGERVWFGCAYLKGVPVAAGCGLQWRNEIEMTWASSIREYNALAPNMLLYWSFLERAVQQGLGIFNFGRSTPGSGPHRFKMQWGATEQPLYWYRWAQRNDVGPQKEDAAMSLATRIWRHVPIPVANALGSRLRGGIPS